MGSSATKENQISKAGNSNGKTIKLEVQICSS